MVTTTTNGREKRLQRAIAGSAITAAVSGIAAIVLSIIGLAHVGPKLMIPIAAIVLGAGLLSEAGTLAAEYSGILSRTRKNFWSKVEFGSGFSAETLIGIAAIVLGILSLLNVKPLVLMPIFVIVLGVDLLFTSGAKSLLNSMRFETPGSRKKVETVAHAALTAAMWIQLLVGLVAITLGILALVGFAPLILTLVATLAIGAAVLLSGAAVSSRMLSVYAA
jgi:hypothetical protein